MRNFFIISVFLLIFSSCSEEFVIVDVSKFNKEIEGKTDILGPEEIIILYYNYPPNESKPPLEIIVDSLGGNNFKVTLISSKLPDDSQEAEKIVMTLTRNGEMWKVLDIKKNWRCYRGRGHTGWGIDPCE
ncbi:MAG: hypothetical protein K8I03_05515 [Ignavibacteria bacterium]|nr:hypothetical protein [Ignavibacteria bacterium]